MLELLEFNSLWFCEFLKEKCKLFIFKESAYNKTKAKGVAYLKRCTVMSLCIVHYQSSHPKDTWQEKQKAALITYSKLHKLLQITAPGHLFIMSKQTKGQKVQEETEAVATQRVLSTSEN